LWRFLVLVTLTFSVWLLVQAASDSLSCLKQLNFFGFVVNIRIELSRAAYVISVYSFV